MILKKLPSVLRYSKCFDTCTAGEWRIDHLRLRADILGIVWIYWILNEIYRASCACTDHHLDGNYFSSANLSVSFHFSSSMDIDRFDVLVLQISVAELARLALLHPPHSPLLQGTEGCRVQVSVVRSHSKVLALHHALRSPFLRKILVESLAFM